MQNIHHTENLFKSPLTCQSCGPVEPVKKWKPMPNGRKHLGAYCSTCGRWIKWLSQTPTDRLAFLEKNLDQLQSIEQSIFEIRQR